MTRETRAAYSASSPAPVSRGMRLLVILVAAAVSGLGACSDSPTSPAAGPAPPTSELPDSQLAELIVSNSQPPRVSTLHAAGNAASESTVSVVYVSLPPGTLPHGRSVRILNATTGATLPLLPLVDGGFDPVMIAAQPGDELTLEFAATSGGFRILSILVGARRPPRVVRVVPPRGRTDVALSIWPSIVFSEPVDPLSLSGGVRLFAGSTEVSGRVSIISAAPWTVEFAPDAPLQPGTAYRLEISNEVQDLDGDPLEEPLTSTFSTESSTGASPGRTYRRVSPWSFSGTSKLVLREDGTFTFQFDRVAFRRDYIRQPLAYVGTYSTSGNILRLQFNATGTGEPWEATATLRNDSLIVAYNAAMREAQLPAYALFEDGVYLHPGDAAPPLPALTGKLAFVRDHEGLPYVHVAAGDLSSVVRIAQGHAPAWSPDGAALVFSRSDLEGSGESSIYRIDADGSNEVRLATGWDPAWSPDGTRILFGSAEGISVMAADGTDVRRLIDLEWKNYLSSPAWSPDGSRIAFTSHPPVGDIGAEIIFTANADGTGLSRFRPVFPTAGDFSPTWSPDGSEILFGSLWYGVALMWPDGQRVVRTLHWDPRAFEERPSMGGEWIIEARLAWALGGEWIIFDKPHWRNYHRTYDSNLYMLRRSGGFPQLLLQDARSPAWTPHE